MKRIVFLLIFIYSVVCARAQKWALKTNLLYDAAATINLGAEMALVPRWTLDISGNLNAWTFSDNKRWKELSLQPEVRYWLCDRYSGHFFGVHAHGGQYNWSGIDLDYKFLGTDFSKLKDNRYQGWFIGAGVAYGYAWVLGRHWNLEAEIGIGYSFTQYDRYRCAGCGKKVESDGNHHYFGVTKSALNLVYVF